MNTGFGYVIIFYPNPVIYINIWLNPSFSCLNPQLIPSWTHVYG